jgi:hypothetical protein
MEQVQEAVETKEVNKTSQDDIKKYLETDEGKKFLNSYTDSRITKAIKTYEEKTLPGLVDAKIKEMYPEVSPEQKALKEMQMELEKIKKEAMREKLLNKALKIATEKNLPAQIIDRFLGDDEETTVENLTLLETILNDAVKKAIEGKLPELGRSPERDKKQNGPMDIAKMSKEDFIKYAKL